AGLPEIILIGTGSEVQHVASAAEQLQADGVRARAVSMPSWELFDEQPEAYREEVLPRAAARRMAVEAGAAIGWERYVGLDGDVVGLTRFGASAPGVLNMEKFGFSAAHVVDRARRLLER